MFDSNQITRTSLVSLFTSFAVAQAPIDCNPALWRTGTPGLGSTLQFALDAAPGCGAGHLLSLSAGPLPWPVGGMPLLPVGPDAIGFPIGIIPPGGGPLRASVAIPNVPQFAGTDLHQATFGVSLSRLGAPVLGPSGRFRVHGPAPASGEIVLITEAMLDNGISTVIQEAQRLNTTPEFLTNDSNTVLVGNPWLPWSSQFAGSIVTLPVGQPGNEGIYTLPSTLPFPLADFVAGLVPQSALGQVPGVLPVRNTDLARLVGRSFVGVVYDSSVSINYQPLQANLQGERYGRFAFTVLDVLLPGTIAESGSSSSHYDLVVRVEPPMAAGAPLAVPFRDAPADSVQINVAEWRNGVLVLSATSALQPVATMTVSVDGFTFESPMTFNTLTAQYEARFVTAQNLVGRRVTVSSREGGSYSATVQ